MDEPAGEYEYESIAVPPAHERVNHDEAFLSRTDLRDLGLHRRAVDAVFRRCPIVHIPGYSRPLIRVKDYRVLIEESTYRGDRVSPVRRAPK